MSFHDAVKASIGAECYAHIEEESEKEVKLAKQKPLQDQYGNDLYHPPRLLLREFQEDSHRFEKVGLKVLPTDIMDVLFGCKLLRATNSEKEYRQRSGGQRIRGRYSRKDAPVTY